MKKLIILLMFGSVLLTSCSKEDSTEQIEDQSVNSIYVLKTLDNESAWESVTLNAPLSEADAGALNRNQVIRTLGRFNGFGLPTSFSGTQNNGGAHGVSLLQLTGPGGTSARLVLRTSSVVSIGDNEVVYGGLITRVIMNTIPPPPPPPPCPTFPNCPPPPPPPPCSPFDLGSYVYFAVKDNGQGNNAPLDQFKGIIIPSCNEIPDGTASFPWFIFPWSDVEQGERILVID